MLKTAWKQEAKNRNRLVRWAKMVERREKNRMRVLGLAMFTSPGEISRAHSNKALVYYQSTRRIIKVALMVEQRGVKAAPPPPLPRRVGCDMCNSQIPADFSSAPLFLSFSIRTVWVVFPGIDWLWGEKGV